MKFTYLKLINFKRFPLLELEVFEQTFNSKLLTIVGSNGSGKAQPLNSYIKVPNGWKLMKDISIGENVIAKDGSITKVTGVFPQGKQDIYKITFRDGRTTKVTKDHLWKIYLNENEEYTSSNNILSTGDIITLMYNYNTKIYIDLPDSENNEDKNFNAYPYSIGSFSAKYSIIDSNNANKIPDQYLEGSTEQRLELVKGLMDINGSFSKNNTLLFFSKSKTISKQLQYLIRSLGGLAEITEVENLYYNYPSYFVNIEYKTPEDLFSIPNKKYIASMLPSKRNMKLLITDIILDSKEEAQCISIDHIDKLYITDDFIVTHNTSLLNELTPLPSDKNNFSSGGYKEIHIEHNRKLYKLISDFRSGAHFSFLVDDEEQNASNNITAQRELAYLHFNINQSIHDILIGTETFTEMSLIARKKLFSNITHINIDNVLENYSKLKEELKSNELLLKTQTTLYQTEEQKLINTTHLDQLKETLTITKEHIDFLLELRTELHRYKVPNDINETYEKVKTILLKIEETINNNYILITSFPKKDIDKYNLTYSSKLNLIKYQLDELYKKVEKKQEELKILNITKQSNISSLLQDKANKEKEYNKLIQSVQFLKNNTTPLTDINSDIYKLEVSLPDILRSIPNNPIVDSKRKYTKEKYDLLLQNKKELLDQLTTISTKEITINKELQELSSTNDNITCPNCNHTWSLKDIPKALSHIKLELQDILTNKSNIQTQLKDNDKLIEDYMEYFTLYKQYTNIRSSTYTSLKPLWNFIDQEQLVFNDPSSILKYLNIITLDMSYIEEYTKLEQELITLNNNIEVLSTYKDTTSEQVQEEIKELYYNIQELQLQKDTISKTILNITKISSTYDYLERLYTALKTSSGLLFSVNLSTTITELLNVIERDLSKYKIILIETEKELSKYETIQYTLDKYKKTIEDTQENIKVLNIILEELSPKNGLIAKSISSFLNIIITNINKIIMSIWNYKMVLKPIDIDTEHLNYRFKVEVEDKLTVEDISKCSAGMKKLINFCFVKLLYRLLELENYPLFLDEFNVNLDPDHSNKFAKVVKDILDSSYHSQLFIISHLSNDYHFKESDIQVISLEN